MTLSVSHRLPSRSQNKPIIAKFVRRETKNQLMREKKKLKGRNKPIFIFEYLTPLRGKLLRVVRSDPNVKSAFTLDGKIICYFKDGNQEKKIVLTNPDDLVQLGWSEEQIAKAGLHLDL